MELALLQQKYTVFIYDSFDYILDENGLTMSFHYENGEYRFVTVTSIRGVTQAMLDRVGKEELDSYIFHLGMAEIPTYWKAFVSPRIEVRCGALTSSQKMFWTKLIQNGMGEFFYVNKIAPFAPVIESREAAALVQSDIAVSTDVSVSVLVPVGGGKDSVVALELLAEAGATVVGYSGHQGSAENVIKTFLQNHPSKETEIVFSRTIDPKIKELNDAGHPNGHTPFSSVLGFLSVLTAKLFSIPYIALANEHSANEATLQWNDILINHQYSKSFEYEEDFRSYVSQAFINPPEYFSFLRPYYELQIIKIFTSYPQYFDVFHSCNVGQKTNTWCGTCPKCAFVALMLSAFLDDEAITAIFRQPVLDTEALSTYIDQLIGLSEEKPFECVGTRTESRAALVLALTRREGKQLPKLLAKYQDWQKTVRLNPTAREILKSFESQHNVPAKLVPILKQKIEAFDLTTISS